ncbi:MAG: metallophosphoesterase [Clostridia bacterium]|nr:metallophosphoesterase [Clostridia bacterium]
MQKFKKLILTALSLCFAASLSLAVACGGGGNHNDTGSVGGSSNTASSDDGSSEIVLPDDDSSDTAEHVCVTEGAWVSDSDGHWIVCTCGEAVEYAEHTTEGLYCESKPVCDVCEAEYGKASGHSYGTLTDGEAGEAYYCACGAYVTNADLTDFTVSVAEGKDPIVLQLSDPQMWDAQNVEEYCYQYIRETVEATKPDLIIVTGDLVYGKFDDNGAIFADYIRFMESFQIPWAPVFGNHDNESLMGVDWQCKQLEAAEYCLFKQGEITGNGNYSVGIVQGGKLLRAFYMMDSNGCSAPMTSDNGDTITPEAGTNEVQKSNGFALDQVLWYKRKITALHEIFPDVKISFAYHIQQSIFSDVPKKYSEYSQTVKPGSSSELKKPLNLDTLETADETDFGYVARLPKGAWGTKDNYISEMKKLGVDSIFVGHEHCNSYSIVYEGIRFQYGQKSSRYDRYNWLTADGTIVGGYGSAMPETATPLMGGTVIPLSQEDGAVETGYIYYCGDPFNPETEEPDPTPVVNGLQFGTDLTVHTAGTVEAVVYAEGINAYKYTSQTDYNKLYIDPELLKGKTEISFKILVETEAVDASGEGVPEFAIRIKPNDLTNQITGSANGYIYYNVGGEGDLNVTLNEWKTVTIDISQFGDACTEFSIYLFALNNTVYVRDIAVA